MRFVLLLLLICPLGAANARVFDYKEAKTAAFVRGSVGLSALDQDPFANSIGSAQVAGSTNYNYSGEVGILYATSPIFHFRFGAEILQEHPVNGEGNAADGTNLFSLNSSVFVFNPNVGFEYVFKASGDSRFFTAWSVGYAMVSVTNKYQMTSAGTTALGVSDFNESLGANVLSGIGSFGFETLFSDHATFAADFGYRYLPVSQLKYNSDVSNIVSPNGAHKGDVVLNGDGSQRTINLSGFFAGVAFRFYLN